MREFCKHCQKITPSMKTLNGKEVCVYCEEQKNKGFDRDKFANDFEEKYGWCPDAGYEEIKND